MKPHIIIVLLSVIILSSCDKGTVNQRSPIPDMPVSYTLNILRDAPILNSPGGYIEVTTPDKINQYLGYGGLLIFCGFDNRYYAYDLSCPHEHDRNVKIRASMAGVAECDSCKSVFDIGFGSGFTNSGPSKYPLRQYTVTRSGDYLRITR